jgi:hypothetical protein
LACLNIGIEDLSPGLNNTRPQQQTRIETVISLAVQLMTLLCGLMVSFLIPALFGLEEYGVFLHSNLLVFLVQKLTNIANEPLISHIEAKSIFPTSISVCSLVLILFSIVNLAYPVGNLWLLASMLLSSSVLLSMYALRKPGWVLWYLCAFLAVFGGSLDLRASGYYRLDITDILIATNFIPAGVAAIALVPNSRGPLPAGQWRATLWQLLSSVPPVLSLTLVFNLFTNVFPFLLSKTLAPVDLGLFRVTASVAQAAPSFFPINTRTIFVALANSAAPERLYSAIVSVSLVYFSVAGLMGCLVSVFWPGLLPYMTLVCFIPALYWAVLSERFLLATRQASFVRLVNLGIGLTAFPVMLFVTTVRGAIICYAVGFSVYALVLVLRASDLLQPIVVFWVCCASLVAVAFFEQSPLVGEVYLAVCIIVVLLLMRPSLTDLRLLRDSL